MSVGFLLVTCCLEPSRLEVLEQVIDNIKHEAPELIDVITVFDNASTESGTVDKLLDVFPNVWRSNANVGYWSAIHWWLNHLSKDPPKYTYIIESDMIHYAFNQIWPCAAFLDNNTGVGSVRLHEYSVKNFHLYNKDKPTQGSKKTIWQSHTNKVTNQGIVLCHAEGKVWTTNFLTQLPALNRYDALSEVIESFVGCQFSELDFQRRYWERYQRTAILDGGIFHCDPGSHGVKAITSSWTPEEELKRLGYQTTRFASITPLEQYTVLKLSRMS